MKILIYILIGLSGGILGGLGMGGGTLLIPLLVLFTDTTQHIAQTVNLVAFIPMSLFALVIHLKNKMVKFRYLLTISLPAAVISVLAALIAKTIDAKQLGRYFGIFLIAIGLLQLVALIVKIVKEKRKAQPQSSTQKQLPLPNSNAATKK